MLGSETRGARIGNQASRSRRQVKEPPQGLVRVQQGRAEHLEVLVSECPAECVRGRASWRGFLWEGLLHCCAGNQPGGPEAPVS